MAREARSSPPYPYSREKKALLARLKKIEGQARGLQRMIEEDRYCVELLQQLSALRAAANQVGLIILQNHIEGCVSDAIREQRGEPAIRELIGVLRKALQR